MTNTEAAVLVGPAQFEIQQFELPKIGPDEGLLEIESCGICGSDIEPYLSGGGPVGAFRKILTPVILGHEMVGRIAGIGPDAAQRWGVQEGDRVVVERWMPCGRCSHCQTGGFPYCVRYIEGQHLFYGGTPTTVAPSLWGGFARHMYLHPDSIVHRVSASGPASVYSMFLPLANAVDWILHSGGLQLGGRVLIQGPGPIGLIAAKVAKEAGARMVVVSGMAQDRQRLELARQLGATHTLIADDGDVAANCLELSDGVGMDLVLDVTSAKSIEPVRTAVRAARASGRVVLATDHITGDTGAEILATVQHKTLTMVGVRGRGRSAAAAALELLGDRAWADELKLLCDPVLPLSQVGEGFRALLDGTALHASVAPSG